eukprot:CAMPEP_0169338394 /NCGR_PEP_ID=MMETSP1017-20121227/17902_1 /TAXON_ID=342587 /ORGANISM="Karlodinium micrum, Strain CCMP2283" /LENGTH=45 /DNA_ID= /DNA_START= /DNA_END= /DNA_ORIENTATION=
MNRAKVRVLKKTNQKCLGSLLQGQDRLRLELHVLVVLQGLRDFPH